MKKYLITDENGRECVDITISKTTITPEVAKEIADVLRKENKPLKNLIFETVSFEPGTFAIIAEALRSHPTLEYLYLVENTYADIDFWKTLIDVLQTIKTLTSFEMQDGSLDVNCIKSLALILEKKDSRLTNLCLSKNKIDNAGAKELAELLCRNKSLVTLKLGGNQIDAEGAQAIAEALRTNRTLVTLYLGGNNIDIAGLRALLKSLVHNTAIEYIGAEWSVHQRQVLDEAYGRNKLLKPIADKIREFMVSKNIACEGEDGVFNFIINGTEEQLGGLAENELMLIQFIRAYQIDLESGIKDLVSSPGPNTGSPEKAIAAAPSSVTATEERPLKRRRVADNVEQQATEGSSMEQLNLTTMDKTLNEEPPQAPWPAPSVFSK